MLVPRKDEKPYHIPRKPGAAMDQDHRQLIVPVTGTSSVRLPDGRPAEQAVPEEYVYADFTFRSIGARNGRDLEFLLKVYLPVLVVPSPNAGRCFLLDLLGFASTSVRVLRDPNLEGILRKAEAVTTDAQLQECLDEALVAAKSIANAESVALRGALSEPTAGGVSQLLGWPLRKGPEAYALVLSPVVQSSASDEASVAVRTAASSLRTAETQVPELIEGLRAKTRQIIAVREKEASEVVTRLDLRVDTLQKEVSSLQSRLKQTTTSRPNKSSTKEAELLELLRARETALKRDLERKHKTVAEGQASSRRLLLKMESMESEMNTANRTVSDCRTSLERLEVAAQGLDLSGLRAVLLIPLVLAGFSKKGRLDIAVYPPSRLLIDRQKIGLRREYVDSMSEASREIVQISDWCEERANSEVAFRKTIRDASQMYNLLMLKNTRQMIREGARMLLADGLIKESALQDLDSMLSGFSEQVLTTTAAAPLSSSLVSGRTAECRVEFRIHNDSGAPVGRAVLELDGVSSGSDKNGVVSLSLQTGLHRGRVSAPGHRDEPIEFHLADNADTVIPVLLTQMSREEQLGDSLDKLVERARRIDMIRDRLWDAFQTHGDTLLNIPAYRSALVELLSNLGYESEAWIVEATKKKGMVKRLLKRDDRSEALRRDVLRIAEESKQSGGIMLFSTLMVQLDDLGWTTNADEIESAIKEMSREGLIEGMINLKGGARLVKFVPVSLTDDPEQILGLAARKEGRLTIEEAVVGLGWTEERVQNALDLLVNGGVAKVQRSYSQSTQYWFPGLRSRKA
ncbi:MAG: hypothetical protein C4K49_03280 [Candidatus Thorarchaeota archaeon]|nr:MAG: hypothetical protein C4K49_03280 [Candidatus Thorarchaeota archaeon]